MQPQRTIALCIFFLLAPSFAQISPNNGSRDRELITTGVVVERVDKGGYAVEAGLRVGDILLDWSRKGRWHSIDSPFELARIETEETAHGAVRVRGLRGKLKRTWLLPAYGWHFSARPNFQGELLRLYELGHELAKSAKVPGAVESWKTAAGLASKSGAVWLPSWFLLRSAQWLRWAGQQNTAFQFYRDAEEQAIQASPEVRADLLWQWASALESSGNTIAAIQQYKAVLFEWRKLGSETVAVAAALIDLGRLAWKQGDLAEAEAYFSQILVMQRHLPQGNIQVSVSLMNLGRIAEGQGDLAKAQAYNQRVVQIEVKRLPRSPHLAEAFSNLAALAHQREDLSSSELYYRKALTAARGHSPGSLEEADVLEALGDCVADRGRPIEAEKLQSQALAIRRKQAPDSLVVASSLAGLGRTAHSRGNLDTAENYYEAALQIAEKVDPAPLELSNFLIGAGNVFRERNELAKAEGCYQKALTIMEKLAPGSANHSETLVALAEILRKNGKLREAVPLYEQAIKDVEHQTIHLGGAEDDRYRYESVHTHVYKNYVALLLELGEPARAFEVLEASRARDLLDLLARGHIDIVHGVNRSLLTQERRLQQQINSKSDYQIRLLQEGHPQEQAASVALELDRLVAEEQELQAQIRASSPAYTALTEPRTWSVHEIQTLLDHDSLLLEFGLGEECSYVWAVTATSITALPLPRRVEIESLVRNIYRLLNERNVIKERETDLQREARWSRNDAEYEKVTLHLSRAILAPIVPLLEHKRLVIVADGALQYIPFAALPVPPNAAPATNLVVETRRPLILDHEIVTLPSASVLAELRARENGRQKPAKAVAVLADPVFDGKDERVQHASTLGTALVGEPAAMLAPRHAGMPSSTGPLTRSLREIQRNIGQGFYLARLPASREEAEAILAVTPSEKGMKALDFEANRGVAMSPVLGQYRIVHIATHGLLNSKHPELSGLVLSMVDKRGNPQDGFLQLQDIYNLRLPVDMVVLSGCETGLGKEISGEGIIGLTRGFMYAGAQRVVASLWSVSDEATAELMARFYQAMERDKLAPAAALRKAQIAMMHQPLWNRPYYWAAFQIQGDWN